MENRAGADKKLHYQELIMCRHKVLALVSEVMKGNFERIEKIGDEISQIGGRCGIDYLNKMGIKISLNASEMDSGEIRKNASMLLSQLTNLQKPGL